MNGEDIRKYQTVEEILDTYIPGYRQSKGNLEDRLGEANGHALADSLLESFKTNFLRESEQPPKEEDKN